MDTSLTITKALEDRNRMRVVAAVIRHDELCGFQNVELLALAPASVIVEGMWKNQKERKKCNAGPD